MSIRPIISQSHPLEQQIQAGLQAWVIVGPTSERREECARRILLCHYDSLTELCLNRLRLTSLPPEIGPLTQLTQLDLCYNQLTSPLLEIGRLTQLTQLDLCYNQLTSPPLEIGQLIRLTHLDLSCNQFSSLPPAIGQLTQLTKLYLSLNQLASLSHTIGQLTGLTALTLNNNQLTSLPEEILRLPSQLSIHLEGNPLSLRVIQNLQRVMNNSGYSGPRITFSMESEENGDNTSTLDQLLTDLAQAVEKPPFILQHLHHEKVRAWLGRLSAIGDYRNKHKEIALLVYQAIEQAEKEAEFRDAFLGCIDEAASTCGDRMALSLLRLDIQYKIAKCLKEGNLKELAYLLGHGSWALSLLETAAENKIRTLNLVDPIEVYLAYPVMLKQSLQLPIILDGMLHFTCSSVTDDDLKTTENYVKGCLSNQETYYTFLASEATWQKALEKRPEYAPIKKRREDAAADPKADFQAIDRQFKAEVVQLTLKVLEEVGQPPFLQRQP